MNEAEVRRTLADQLGLYDKHHYRACLAWCLAEIDRKRAVEPDWPHLNERDTRFWPS